MAANSRRSHSTGFSYGNLWLLKSFANRQRPQYIMVKPHFSHSAHYYIIIKKEGNTQPILHIKIGVQSGKVYSQGMFGQCTIAKLSCSFMDISEDGIHTHNLTCLMMEGICWTQSCTQSKDDSNNQRKIIIMTILSRLTKRGTPSRKR